MWHKLPNVTCFFLSFWSGCIKFEKQKGLDLDLCINLVGLAALLQFSNYTCLSVSLVVCLSLHFCMTVTVNLCLTVHPSVCLFLSMSVFLASCLPVNHIIHSSFTMVLGQSLYNPNTLCLSFLSFMSSLCAMSEPSLMSSQMIFLSIRHLRTFFS